MGYDIGFDEYLGPAVEMKNRGGSGGTCFMASAAYGTPLATDIDILRTFRDNRLLSNGLGHAFSDTYYRLSAPVVDYVAKHEVVRGIVRLFISIVLVAIEFFSWYGGLLLLLLLLLMVGRRKLLFSRV